MIIGNLYFMERRDIQPQDRPYLTRWIVFQCALFGIYVHKFWSSDDERALHDHPWNFVSIILKGRYKEYCDMDALGRPRQIKLRTAGSIAFRKAGWRHRVQLIDTEMKATRRVEGGRFTPVQFKPVWTLMLVSGRVRSKWGFWPAGLFCWWRTYNQGTGICGDEVLYTYGQD